MPGAAPSDRTAVHVTEVEQLGLRQAQIDSFDSMPTHLPGSKWDAGRTLGVSSPSILRPGLT